MFRIVLVALFLAAVSTGSVSAVHAKTCIRDLAGQIVCGELVETRDEPTDQTDPRQDDSPDMRPATPRAAMPAERPHRYYNDGPIYPPERHYYREQRYRGPPPSPYNAPRPIMGANGQISCNNPHYTWQDGACKPYRGR